MDGGQQGMWGNAHASRVWKGVSLVHGESGRFGRKTPAVWRFVAVCTVTAVVSYGSAGAAEVLTLATTTSTENSGLLAHIHPAFEKATGVQVKVIAKGTGASLQLGRDGNVDVVLVHAREREEQFVAEGYGVMRREVMYNDFVLLGPGSDPAGVRGLDSVVEALRRIAAKKATFVSRGDESGTHIKEQALWKAAGIGPQGGAAATAVQGKSRSFESVRPEGDWYLSIGQGMGKTISFATEKRGYTLADRGAYYAFALAEPVKTDLAVLCEGDDLLVNSYGVIAVNPERHPHVRFDSAKRYIEWITSPQAQAMIAGYEFQGKALFFPSAGEPEVAGPSPVRPRRGGVLEYAGRSLLVALAATLIASAVGIPLGVLIAEKSFRGKRAVVTVLNTLLGLPTVVVGLLVYSFLSRAGTFGSLKLLFTVPGIIIGEFILIVPIVTAFAMTAVARTDRDVRKTALALGAGGGQALWTVVRESRFGVLAAVIAAFGRVVSEVGVAMIVGGNIDHATRTMTTAIVLNVAMGNFALALLLGVLLLAISLSINVVFQCLQGGGPE